MRNDSSLNYNTKYSKIQNFKDFEENIRKEKDVLKKIKRGYKNNKDGSNNLANISSDKLKFNKITHKTDNNFGKDLVSDFIHELDDKVKDTNHKYKLEKTQDKAKMESYQEFVQNKNPMDMMGGDNDDMDMDDSNYSDDSEVTSYMFFGNLKTIHRMSKEILEMDESRVNQILDDGHNWAEDHITSAKVQVTHVYNFLMNETSHDETEHNENHNYNYMFFANLETICEQCEELLSLNDNNVDDTLVNGHDWAEDHITSAKENIEQVYEFLQNEMR